MSSTFIKKMRPLGRELIRELGLLEVNKDKSGRSPQHWHALVEIDANPGCRVSFLSEALVLSFSATSRMVDALVSQGLVESQTGSDKRQKLLHLTKRGQQEITKINDFSNKRLKGAMHYLSEEQQQQITAALELYVAALKQNRLNQQQIKLYTLPAKRSVRKQVIEMIEVIQKGGFNIAITPDINACVLKAEEYYHADNKCNFWYAMDDDGQVIGSIGLKKLNNEVAEIKKFFVAKPHRGRGLAQQLMKKCIKRAHDMGTKQIILGTVSVLESAIHFYQKIGFELITQPPAYYDACPLDTHFFLAEVEEVLKSL